MKKFFIKTLGCKTNQAESAAMADILTAGGFIETENALEADYYILNSCSVTHTADTKNLSYLRRIKKENPNVKTVLTGCMAQLEKENLIKNNTADFVIGNYEKNDAAKILASGIKYSVSDIFSHKDFRSAEFKRTKKTRAFVKIQDGCNSRCSYCTIPYARGISRSAPAASIIKQINELAEAGFYEAALTGIHIGQWGLDFKEPETLMKLLEKIEETEIKRYRLGSLTPDELDEKFIDFLASSKKFCPHFHLSLQSCSDNTLKAMNRHYNAEKISEIVNYINKKFDSAFTGCDIIAGFPGETEADFEETRKNLENLKLSKMHIFPYSRRNGTLADTMPEQIKEEEKKRRADILQKMSDDKCFNFLKSNINTIQEVIIEKSRDKKTNLLKGVTRNYINVLVKGAENIMDTVQNVIITGFADDNAKMAAEIINQAE